MTLDWTADQKRMMQAFGQSTAERNPKQAGLYLRMMVEELAETLVAANPSEAKAINTFAKMLSYYCVVAPDHDLVEMFDGAVDLHVVTLGFGVAMDLPMAEGWDAVLDTNLVKVDPTTGLVRRRADGKVLKPEGWVPPTEVLQRLLEGTA